MSFVIPVGGAVAVELSLFSALVHPIGFVKSIFEIVRTLEQPVRRVPIFLSVVVVIVVRLTTFHWGILGGRGS